MRAWRRSCSCICSRSSAVPLISPSVRDPPAPMDWPSHCLRSATFDRRPSPPPAACHCVLLAASGTVKALLAWPAALHRHHSRPWVRSTTHEAPSGGLHRLKRHHTHRDANDRVYKGCLSHPLPAASSTRFPRSLSLVYRDSRWFVLSVDLNPTAGPGFATPLLLVPLCHACTCTRRRDQSIPSWQNPFQARHHPCRPPQAKVPSWPGTVKFTYSQALSAALSCSVPSSAYSRLGLHPHCSGPLSLPVSFILPALHCYIVPFSRRTISFCSIRLS